MKELFKFIKFILIMGALVMAYIFSMIVKNMPIHYELTPEAKEAAQQSPPVELTPAELPEGEYFEGTYDYSMSSNVPTEEATKESSDESSVVVSSEEDIYDNLDEEELWTTDGECLEQQDLPSDIYGKETDFSSFQPYMDVDCITSEGTPAYEVCNSWRTYVDENGLLRSIPDENQFNLGLDDYVVAMGTYYKEKGTAGTRYLIVTTTGMFTVITGDEKDDAHTEGYNMGTIHVDSEGNESLAILEWIVDEEQLDSDISTYGTVTAGPIEVLRGDITNIYKIS